MLDKERPSMSNPDLGVIMTWTWKGNPQGLALRPTPCATKQYIAADINGRELCPTFFRASPRKLCSREWYSRSGSRPVRLFALSQDAIARAFWRGVRQRSR